MKGRKSKQPFFFTAGTLLLTVGYSLFRTVSYNSYVTNFTVTAESFGYISYLPFMFSASIGIVVAAVVIFFLARFKVLKYLKLSYVIPLVVIVLCYFFAPLLAHLVGYTLFLPILGFVWGLATTMVSISFIELFTHEKSSEAIIFILACASLFSAVINALLVQLPQTACTIICIVFALLCVPIIWKRRNDIRVQTPQSPDTKTRSSAKVAPALQKVSTIILAYFFFELIVGLINMFAYQGASSFSISTNTPLQGMLISSILVVIFVFVTSRTPSQSIIYLLLLPLTITVFMVLPFFGEQLGSPLSSVIYAAHVFTSMFAMFCCVDTTRTTGADAYQVAALLAGGVRVMLMIGFGLGFAFSTMFEAENYVRMGIVALSCIYLLGIVIVFWGYRNSKKRGMDAGSGAGAQQEDGIAGIGGVVASAGAGDETGDKPATFSQSYEQLVADRVEELVAEYGLTNRERDVLIGLSKGKSAARIAEDLFISTSTVQGYIKTLYPKLGVNKKQQVLDLFE